jgi:hypothetical protein
VAESLDDDDTVLAGIQTPGMTKAQRAELAAKVRAERAQVSAYFGGTDIPGWVAFYWSSLLPREGWQWGVCRAVHTIREFGARENGDFGTALRYALARSVLEKQKTRRESGAFGAVAGERGAAEDLEKKLGPALWMLAEALSVIEAPAHGIPGKPRPLAAEAPEVEGGMLILDARFAAFLEERYGEAGEALAGGWREKARERWQQFERDQIAEPLLTEWWTPGTTQFDASEAMVYLTLAIWRHEIGPKLEEARRKPAALTYVVTSNVLDLHSRRYQTQSRDGQQALVFPEERGWVLVPSLSDGALASILERGVGLLTSQTGIDLLEWEVTEAHRQYTETGGASDFRHITIEGGWAALAHEKLGKQTRKAAEEVRAIVLAQAHLQFQAQGCRGNLLTYAEPRAEAPGRRSRVTITLGDMLLAGFAHQLREELGTTSLSSREARRLVPILGKTALVGRPNDYAAQRRMVWRFAMALRTQAPELAERGHVAMPLDTWATLAAEAGAPRSGDFLAKVQTAWEKGDERAGVEPLIVRVEGERDRYTLHESRKAALEFIVEGGRRTTKKRAEGKASARKRDHKVRHKKGAA